MKLKQDLCGIPRIKLEEVKRKKVFLVPGLLTKLTPILNRLKKGSLVSVLIVPKNYVYKNQGVMQCMFFYKQTSIKTMKNSTRKVFLFKAPSLPIQVSKYLK